MALRDMSTKCSYQGFEKLVVRSENVCVVSVRRLTVPICPLGRKPERPMRSGRIELYEIRPGLFEKVEKKSAVIFSFNNNFF
ncbi:hypothetical protein L596_002566 [Steinernema carpocapsae]|uniref:Uncharacterized protein n=1 Tax=Steinernema carpocapsae TaxID=34508 RepID=A0A4U8UPK4_STECR|nr:hypothetical protein L596_002566 [Steinernema carpocapsae]